jgi:hypothetical protein
VTCRGGPPGGMRRAPQPAHGPQAKAALAAQRMARLMMIGQRHNSSKRRAGLSNKSPVNSKAYLTLYLERWLVNYGGSAPDLLLAGPRLGYFPVALGQRFCWGHIGHCRLQFVLPAGDDVALTLHHRLEAGLSDLHRIVLLLLPERGVEHVGSREELGLGRAGHQARDRYAGVLQSVPKREREGVNKRLGAAIDCLETAGHEAGHGTGDEDTALPAGTHVAPDFLNR